MSTKFRFRADGMPTEEYYVEKIEQELRDAGEARRQKNEGRVRVCARRAAGFAIALMHRSKGKQAQENNSLYLLKSIQSVADIPNTVRDAATRLTARITSDFRYPFSTDPLDDARIIINYVKNLLA